MKQNNMTNKVITAGLIITVLALAAIGYQSNRAPNQVGHSAEEIEVAAGQTLAQFVAAQTPETPVTCTVLADNPSFSSSMNVAVPAACRDPEKGCYLVVRSRYPTGTGLVTSVVPYIQSASGRPYFLVSSLATKLSNAPLPNPMPVGDLTSRSGLRQFLRIAEATDPAAFPTAGLIVDGYPSGALSVYSGQFTVGMTTKVWVCA